MKSKQSNRFIHPFLLFVNNHLISICLGLIVLVAFLVRLINLPNNPSRLTHDEMSVGYNAYSIVETGKDEWNRAWPLNFEAFGDHKLPGAIYATALCIKLFGLNSFALKLPSLLAGTALVVFIYCIASLMISKRAGLLAASLIATNPWPIHLSRMMLESNLALCLFALSILFYLKARQVSSKTYLCFAFIFSVASCYFYIAYRLLSLLLIIAILFSEWRRKKTQRQLTLSLILLTLFLLLPLAPNFFSNSGTARFNQVGLFANEGIAALTTERQNYCFLSLSAVNPLLSRACSILIRPELTLFEHLSKTYSQLLLPNFYFLPNDQSPYLTNPAFGEFYLWLAPFFVIGLTTLISQSFINQSKQRLVKFPKLLWFLLLSAPLASTLTLSAQVIRASAMIIPLSLIIALGLESTFYLFKSHQYKFLYWISLGFLLTLHLSIYSVHSNLIYANQFASSYYLMSDEVIYYLARIESGTSNIYINDQSYPDANIAIAYYRQLDPQWYRDHLIRYDKDALGFSHAQSLGKYRFGNWNFLRWVCAQEQGSVYVGKGSFPLKPTTEFRDFSGVHIQTAIFEFDQIVNQDEFSQLLDSCSSLDPLSP